MFEQILTILQNKIDNIIDIYEQKLKAQVLYVNRQQELGRTCHNTPFYRGVSFPYAIIKPL